MTKNGYNEIIEQINKNLPLTKLKELIIETSDVAWGKDINSTKLDKWINNFDGSAIGDSDAEKSLAAWMLLNFVFYTLDDVRGFCKSIYEDFIHKKLIEYKENNLLQDKSINEQIDILLKKTVFVALGNASESGSNILYFFRQENQLPKILFEKDITPKYENLVFIDDVTISGRQAIDYINKISIEHDNKYFLTFISTKKAIESFQDINISVISATVITDREKCFSDESYVFSGVDKEQFKEVSKTICSFYGAKILSGHINLSDHPLGYDDGQQMFGFYYNTPDNALPIFWGNLNGWIPAFKRYDKIYSRKAVNLNESIYV